MTTGGKFGRSQIDASDAIYDCSCNPCANRGKNTEGIFKCVDCHLFYCQRCVIGHNEFTKGHNVVDKSSKLFGQGQIKHARSMSSSELPEDLCEEHHGEVIKMYCGQHDLVCCTVCIAVNHRSCKGIEYIPNIAKEYLKRLNRNKTETSLERVREMLKFIKSDIEDELKNVNKRYDECLLEIERFKKHIIKIVEEWGEASIAGLRSKFKEIDAKIATRKEKVDDTLQDVENHLKKLKQAKVNNDAQTIVDIKQSQIKISRVDAVIKDFETFFVEILSFQRHENIKKFLRQVKSLGSATIVRRPVWQRSKSM